MRAVGVCLDCERRSEVLRRCYASQTGTLVVPHWVTVAARDGRPDDQHFVPADLRTGRSELLTAITQARTPRRLSGASGSSFGRCDRHEQQQPHQLVGQHLFPGPPVVDHPAADVTVLETERDDCRIQLVIIEDLDGLPGGVAQPIWSDPKYANDARRAN